MIFFTISDRTPEIYSTVTCRINFSCKVKSTKTKAYYEDLKIILCTPSNNMKQKLDTHLFRTSFCHHDKYCTCICRYDLFVWRIKSVKLLTIKQNDQGGGGGEEEEEEKSENISFFLRTHASKNVPKFPLEGGGEIPKDDLIYFVITSKNSMKKFLFSTWYFQ